MELAKNPVIDDIQVNTPNKSKEHAARYYLYLLGLYVVLVFNEFIKRPVDYLALALIIVGLPLINKDNIKLLKASISQSLAAKMVFWGLFAMSALFFVATLRQLPRYDGLIAFGAQYGVHIGLGLMALLIVPLNINTLCLLFNSLLFALVALIFSDIGFYIYQVLDGINIGVDYSHRWLGDGYVFLAPYLLMAIVAKKSRILKDKLYEKILLNSVPIIMLYALFIVLMVLVGGTGSRSSYGILFLETLFFLWIYFRLVKIPCLYFFLALPFLCSIFMACFMLISPDLFVAAMGRGVSIVVRIQTTWLTTIAMINESPWMGSGFGQVVWTDVLSSLKLTDTRAAEIPHAHNWFLQAGFLGGYPAILVQAAFSYFFIFLFQNSYKLFEAKLWLFSLPSLISFVMFYLIRGLVEFPTYKFLSINIFLLGVVCIIQYHVAIDMNSKLVLRNQDKDKNE